MNLYLINKKEFIGMYRWLSREFTTVECTRTCEQCVTCDHQSIHDEAVTTNREIVANHLAYTFVYVFSSRNSMNKVILIGRLVKDPDIRTGTNNITIARYALAVERQYRKDNERKADFINCVALGKNGEFAEKYLHKGMKIAVIGSWQTGNYTDTDGKKIYTNDCLVETHEFVESKGRSNQSENIGTVPPPAPASDTFVEPAYDPDLPFS